MSQCFDWDDLYEAATEQFCQEFYDEHGREATEEEIEAEVNRKYFIEDYMSSLAD
jgi:hypothetical protein